MHLCTNNLHLFVCPNRRDKYFFREEASHTRCVFLSYLAGKKSEATQSPIKCSNRFKCNNPVLRSEHHNHFSGRPEGLRAAFFRERERKVITVVWLPVPRHDMLRKLYCFFFKPPSHPVQKITHAYVQLWRGSDSTCLLKFKHFTHVSNSLQLCREFRKRYML